VVLVLPTFLVIGAAKAGTTSLHEYLAAHPDVFMSDPKELDFFISSINWDRGLPWYESHFDGAAAKGATAVGESSPLYSAAQWYDGVPERIASVLPDVRLVYLVRDPIARMRSQYIHHLELGRETRPPGRALRENQGYLQSSLYAWQLERFTEHLPRERILVVPTERLRSDRAATMAEICTFLGVEPLRDVDALEAEHHRSEEKLVRRPTIVALKRNRAYRAASRLTPAPARRVYGRLTARSADPRTVEIDAALRDELVARLRPDVEALRRDWLGPDFQGWGLLEG
jgi:hypothetical protein